MADPLSIATGVVALSGVALQAGKSLLQTIESIRNSKRAARELRDEVEALLQTLEVLKNVVKGYETELSALKLPLQRCAVACKELGELISQCVKHSDGERTSLRDWTKLQYLGDDISNYKNVLANYKATINIALGGATFQSIAVTREMLQNYKDMIHNTTSDLEDRLSEIEQKRTTSYSSEEPATTINHEELRQIEEEKQSTTDCLQICRQVSGYIEQYQLKCQDKTEGPASSSPHENTTTAKPNSSISQQIAQGYLNTCLQNMNAASARLQQHFSQLEANLQSNGSRAMSNQVTDDLQKIMEEKETITQCLNICADASSLSESSRVNIFEDVASLDDSQQVLVSTIGDLLNAKRINTGMRSLQVLGQMSDDTLQHLSLRHNHEGDNVVNVNGKEGTDFQSRHGTGRSLWNEKSGQKSGSFRSAP